MPNQVEHFLGTRVVIPQSDGVSSVQTGHAGTSITAGYRYERDQIVVGKQFIAIVVIVLHAYDDMIPVYYPTRKTYSQMICLRYL